MKKLVLLLPLLLVVVNLYAPAEKVIFIMESQEINPYLEAWDAVATVESSKNPKAVNLADPRGGSHGIVQIGKLMLNWYNKKYGTHYTFEHCYRVDISRKIFMAHMMQFNTIEAGVKRWNGSGPKAEKYWHEKVKPLL